MCNNHDQFLLLSIHFSKAVSVSVAHVIGMGIVTFSAILWHFCDLYDLFSTFVTFLWITKRVTILWMTKWHYLDLIMTFVTFLWMILSRSNCDLFWSFIIITHNWYLNQGPLDLQSNTTTVPPGTVVHSNFPLITYLGPENKPHGLIVAVCKGIFNFRSTN